ncbi:PREDICTED: uncharacterized protein LOC106896268, partial [Calidris pugnax]
LPQVTGGPAAGFLLQALGAASDALEPLWLPEEPGGLPRKDPLPGTWVSAMLAQPLVAFGYHRLNGDRATANLLLALATVLAPVAARLPEEGRVVATHAVTVVTATGVLTLAVLTGNGPAALGGLLLVAGNLLAGAGGHPWVLVAGSLALERGLRESKARARFGVLTLDSSLPSPQCTNGHLMCAGCFIHLLADARLKEEQATCPNCRCEISKSLCCRNLAVEKAVSELPSECGFCMQQFPRSLLERHQKEECQDRVTQCKYKRIGCPWQGPYHELTVHEAECTHPTKTGNELMEILDEMDQTRKKEMQLYNSIFNLLSFEKIGYTGKWATPCPQPRPGLGGHQRISPTRAGCSKAPSNLGLEPLQGWGNHSFSGAPQGAELQKAKEKAQRSGNPAEEAALCNQLGEILASHGRYEEALEEHRQELRLLEGVGDSIGCAVAHRKIGERLAELENYEAALKHQRRHLELARSLSDETEQQRAWATIGRTYMFVADSRSPEEAAPALRQAEEAFLTSLAIVEEKLEGTVPHRELREMRTRLYLNLGLVYDSLKEPAKCDHYIRKSIFLAEQGQLLEDLYRAYFNLGNIQLREGEPSGALRCLARARDCARRMKEKGLESECCASTGQVLLSLGDFGGARRSLRQAHALGSRQPWQRQLVRCNLRY